MLIEPYRMDELSFAYRLYVYFRWHTYRRRPLPTLAQLTREQLQAVHPEIHVLELATEDPEIGLMASLQPTESVSTAASKLKGAASKTLRQLQGLTEPTTLLAGGYFAASVGDNTSAQLADYLQRQGSHHGYDHQVNPPVWVQTWQRDESDRAALQTAHASTLLHWHLVLADHIHIAVWAHPTEVPAQLALRLLNSSQELIARQYPHLLIEAKVPRMWKPSAYLGTYGDIRKSHVRNYLLNWARARED